MRLSQTNENCQRAANHQPTTTVRTQEAVCVNYSLPKTARLIKRHDFRRLQREGSRFSGAYLTFCFEITNPNLTKLGITVSKKFGHAAKRNLFKRRVREAFRLCQHTLPEGLQIHVSPKTNTPPSFAQIKEDFTLLIHHVECGAAKSS